MLIGYMRVSKADGGQALDLQRDVLLAAGVDPSRLYEDNALGKPPPLSVAGATTCRYSGRLLSGSGVMDPGLGSVPQAVCDDVVGAG